MVSVVFHVLRLYVGDMVSVVFQVLRLYVCDVVIVVFQVIMVSISIEMKDVTMFYISHCHYKTTQSQ